MKIISWNTNGIRATHKAGLLTPLFATHKPDIVCLQEVKAEPSQLTDDIKNIPGFSSYFAWPTTKKGYSGVAIYTKEKPKEVTLGIGIAGLDDEGRVISAFFDLSTGKLVVINCYFPNGGGGPVRLKYKLDFYDAFLKYIDTLRKKGYAVIFCGDVNTAHEEIDLARPKENEEHTGFLPEERAWLDEVVTHGWIDIFRHLYPNKKDVYTYWDQKSRARDRNVGWRIDYFFVSPDLVSKVKDTKMLPEYYGSDHCPISLDLKL